jgi:hypothetical protein
MSSISTDRVKSTFLESLGVWRVCLLAKILAPITAGGIILLFDAMGFSADKLFGERSEQDMRRRLRMRQ